MKVASTASTASPSTGRPSRFSFIVKALAAATVFIAYSAALVSVGMLAFRSLQSDGSGQGPEMSYRAMPKRLVNASKNHLTAIRRNAPFERLHLDIKFKHLEKLRAKQQEAMDAGVLMASNEDFVPATIRYAGRSVETKIRLKGDALDHLHGDKWSLRVKIQSNDQLFGMRRFSLQSPGVRDFQAEPIYLKHLRSEGVLTPRYHFVEVTVNGKDIGVMAVEEHFAKELLESQRRREGVIVRFDENPAWRNLSTNGTFGPYGNPHAAMLTPFDSSKIAESPELTGDLATATGMMRGFLAGKLSAPDVFDVELMTRFMAVSEVWRTPHPLVWHNLRFYFNPLSARLEPVGFDGNVQAVIFKPGIVTTHGDFTPLLLEDPVFRAAFIRNLARIAEDMADGSLVGRSREIEADLVPRLQEGFQYIERMRFDDLIRRAQNLALITEENFDFFLPPMGDLDMPFPLPLRAYLCTNCESPSIEFANLLPVPVEVLSVASTQKPKNQTDAAEPTLRATFPLILSATADMQAPKSTFVEVHTATDPVEYAMEAVVRVVGQSQRHIVPIEPYFDVATTSPIPKSSLEEALALHSFLSAAEADNAILVAPGVWNVVDPLVIPEGMALQISAGTELRFPEDGIVVSSGPLIFEGTAEQPITLAPQVGTATWGGMISVRTDAPHVFKHVVVRSTSGIKLDGWRLTGGVTLRFADVKISDSTFTGDRGEDALNIIRSRFELSRVVFHDTTSDALDVDFSEGVIQGGRFSKIGGDGIDVSGTQITIDGTVLTEINDKAISVGEASRLTARNIRIEKVSIGAASKDGSVLVLEDSYVSEATTAAVSAYTKKPVYGPAQARIDRVEMQNVATKTLVQMGSRATVDGVDAVEQPFDTDIMH
jgi:hypothetical protein